MNSLETIKGEIVRELVLRQKAIDSGMSFEEVRSINLSIDRSRGEVMAAYLCEIHGNNHSIVLYEAKSMLLNCVSMAELEMGKSLHPKLKAME